MNAAERSPIPEEWLSGHLDGELSAEESAAVESALASDPRLAKRMESLREVRDLLRSLPAPRLSGSVLDGRSLDEPVVADLPAARPRGGRVTGRIVGILTAATALGLAGVAAVIFLPPVNRNVGDAAVVQKEIDGDLPDGVAVGSVEAPMPASSAAGESAVADAMEPLVNLPLIDTTPPKFLPPTADVPRPGQLVSILENDEAGEVTVVEWVVADVDTSLGELRLLLQRLGVPASAVQDAGPATRGELRAVYVQADEELMTRLIAQSRQQSLLFAQSDLLGVDEARAASRAVAPTRAESERAELERAALPADDEPALAKTDPAPAEEAAAERFTDYDVLAKPKEQPFQQVLNIDPRSYSTISGNSFRNAGRYGGNLSNNRLLLVIKEEEDTEDRPM